MSTSNRWIALLLSSALLFCAPLSLQAQVDTAKVDSVARAASADSTGAAVVRDSLRADSLRAEAIRKRVERLADTIKAPLPQFTALAKTEPLRERVWNREQIMASGAMNLADLLDDVPGVATFRSAWFPGVHVAAYQGSFRRIRVFRDGVELSVPELANNGVLDLVEISIAALDEVAVERAAGELRVWLTSWTVRSVTPYSRTDAFTGDLNTNGFRGLFGRRFMNGVIFQFTIQQGESSRQRGNIGFGGSSARGRAGDGDIRQIASRVGWAGARFSVDAYLESSARSRDSTSVAETTLGRTIPAYDGSRQDAYVRVGYRRDTTPLGLSAQLLIGVATSSPTGLETDPALTDTTGTLLISPDSGRTIAQRVAQVVYNWPSARAELFARWRSAERDCYAQGRNALNRFPLALSPCDGSGGLNELSPGLRLSGHRYGTTAALFAERNGLDSSARVDASARVQPISWLALSTSHSEYRPDAATARSSERATRVEAAVGSNDRWVSAGLVRNDLGMQNRQIIVPRVLTPFDTSSRPTLSPYAGTALTFGLSARLYKAVQLQVDGRRWGGALEYQPQTAVRAVLSLQSEWRSRFPKGDFGFNARLIHEYRSAVTFPYPDAEGTVNFFRRTDPYNFATALIEIRIIKATLFYQFRNVYGAQYAQTPGIPMPPPFQMYGVRWDWFN